MEANALGLNTAKRREDERSRKRGQRRKMSKNNS